VLRGSPPDLRNVSLGSGDVDSGFLLLGFGLWVLGFGLCKFEFLWSLGSGF
jgi:hypothetical protein